MMNEHEHSESDCNGMFDIDYERRVLRKDRTIILSGEVDSGVAHIFIEDMKMILLDKAVEPITIIINSPGGNVFNGIAIIGAIKSAQRLGIEVLGVVRGHACSMAFFILEVCDLRYMGSFDILMAHGITTGFMGDLKNLDAEQKLLLHWHSEFAEMVANRCVGEFKESGFWFEVLRDNTPQWYTAKESKEMGLVDFIDDN